MKRELSHQLDEGSMKLRGSVYWIVLLAALALPKPAHALFHLMEIEQVIGGVNGDTTAQAVQLRMRAANQNFLNGAVRLRAWDAAGANPVILIAFSPLNSSTGLNPASGAACRRILIATPGFEATSNPHVTSLTRDYLMEQRIPSAYLAAGSLTFEDMPPGTKIYWRVSWGGSAYTGAAAGNVTTAAAGGNDADGTMSPPYAGPLPPLLPSTGLDALRFTPNCAIAPTNNSLQYALSSSPAIFTNNFGTTFTVTAPPPVPIFPGSSGLVLVVALGALAAGAAVLRRRLA
jgi:hypothetical protein